MKTITIGMMIWGLLLMSDLHALPDPAQSTLKFEIEKWDFGNIREEDGNVSHTFVFTNIGSTPFVIERVTTSCGCTTPEYSREPILPGRQGKIEVTFNPQGRPGPFQKTITVTSNQGKNQNKVYIIGTVTARPRTPQEDFPIELGEGFRVTRQSCGLGYLPRGGTKSTTLNYMNDSPVSVTLDASYTQKNSYFSIVFSPRILPPGGKGVMTLTYDLRQADLWGRVYDEFRISVNGQWLPVRLSATGIAVEDYASMSQQELDRAAKAFFSSQYYHFGNLKAGTIRKRTFTLTNNGSQILKIQYLKPGPHMDVTLQQGTEIAPGQSIVFTATLKTEGVQPGRFMDNTVIILNDPIRPMRELRLAATIL